jgi:hypothetical protein
MIDIIRFILISIISAAKIQLFLKKTNKNRIKTDKNISFKIATKSQQSRNKVATKTQYLPARINRYACEYIEIEKEKKKKCVCFNGMHSEGNIARESKPSAKP